MPIKRSLAAAALLGCLLARAGAHATTLDFSYQSSLGFFTIDASWKQPATPAPLAATSGAFTDIAVTDGTFAFGATGGPLTPGAFTDVDFYDAAYSGPLGPGGFEAGPVGDFGPQLFSGDETAPVFAPGTYSLANGVLIVSAVTEPATWSLILVGFGGLGGALRLRPRLAKLGEA